MLNFASGEGKKVEVTTMNDAEPRFIDVGKERIERIDGPLLIQLPDWVRTGDGNQYNLIWGRASVMKAEEVLGVKPHNSANWFLCVGSGEKRMLIAGCRIHYVLICPVCPEGGNVYNAEDRAKTHRWLVSYRTANSSGTLVLTVERDADLRAVVAARLQVEPSAVEIVETERV